MSQIKAVEFNQFLPTSPNNIIPLINLAASVSQAYLNANFITTTIEHDLITDVIFEIERLYKQTSAQKKDIIYTITKNKLFNSNTGRDHETLILIFDCNLAKESTHNILAEGGNSKVVFSCLRQYPKS